MELLCVRLSSTKIQSWNACRRFLSVSSLPR